jgi:hypothetical protein
VCHSARETFDTPPISQAETRQQKVQHTVSRSTDPRLRQARPSSPSRRHAAPITHPRAPRPQRSMFSTHRSVIEIHACTSKVHRSLPAIQRCMCANTSVYRQRLIDNRNPYNDASFANTRAPQGCMSDVRRVHRSVPGDTSLHPKRPCVRVGCTTTYPTAAAAVDAIHHLPDAGEPSKAHRRHPASLAPRIPHLPQPILGSWPKPARPDTHAIPSRSRCPAASSTMPDQSTPPRGDSRRQRLGRTHAATVHRELAELLRRPMPPWPPA